MYDGHSHFTAEDLPETQNKPDYPDKGQIPDNLGDEAELNNKLSQKGYLTKVKFASNYKFKNLHGNFSWPSEKDDYDIPMLSVITGKNGIGKTALLEAILQGFERKIANQSQFEVELNFDEELTAGDIPDVFEFSSASPNGMIRGSTSQRSAERHTEDINRTFEDLKKYDLSKRYGQKYKLKYPNLRKKYKRVITSFETENEFQIDSLNPDDYYHNFYNSLKVRWEGEAGIHISTYASLEKFPKYLLVDRKVSIEDLNNHLEKHGFKYTLSPKSYQLNHQKRITQFDRLAFQEKGNSETVDHSWLSPGERLELLTLLWLYASRIINQSDKGAIFVLDEFDAHLHPSLAKEVIDVIKTRLVGEYDVQVIMTTHNPTTVSLVSKDSLYIMSNDNSGEKVEIKKATSRKQAIQLLTSDFVCVNQPFRLVFVEAENDKKFYQFVREKLISLSIIKPNEQLLFMNHSKNRKDSSCDLVRSIVMNCVESTQDDDKSLREHIFGIVDGDNKERPPSSNILAVRRYSIESYIYDPIHIYFSVKQKNPTLASFIQVDNRIKDLLKSKNLNIPESFDAIFTYEIDVKCKILQVITDCITGKLMEFFQKKIDDNDPDFEDAINSLNGERFKHLVNNNKKIISNNEEISFAGDIKLIYPQFILEMQGHRLEFIYSRIFTNSIDKNHILSVVCKNNMLISLDLVDIFKKLQNPLKDYDQKLPLKRENQKLNGNNKPDEKMQGQLDKYKLDLSNNQKTINNQRIKIKQLEDRDKLSSTKLDSIQQLLIQTISVIEQAYKAGFTSSELYSVAFKIYNTLFERYYDLVVRQHKSNEYNNLVDTYLKLEEFSDFIIGNENSNLEQQKMMDESRKKMHTYETYKLKNKFLFWEILRTKEVEIIQPEKIEEGLSI